MSIKKNYIYNLSYQMVSALIPIILTPYISRILSADGVGVSSYITANVTYFQLFSMLGIAGHGQREIAIVRDNKEQASKVFWELQILHIISSACILFLYINFIILSDASSRIYYLISVITLIGSLLDITWLYNGFERFRDIAIKNIIAKGSTIVLCLLLVKGKDDVGKYIAINCTGIAASNLFLWVSVRNYVFPLKAVKHLNIRRHIKSVLVFFIPTIAASVYSILDKTVINIITHSNAENGYYENAYKILSILNVAVHNLSTVMAPRMSHVYGTGDTITIKKYLNRALETMLLLAMPLSLGMTCIANRFIPVFLGSGWDPVIPLVYVFMPLVVVLGFSVYIDGMYLVPTGKRLQSAKIICIGAGLNLGLNIVLVTFLNAVGAAIATLITETFIAVFMMVLAKGVIDWIKIGKAFARYTLLSLVMIVCIILVSKVTSTGIMGIIEQVGCGVLCYGIGLLIIRDNVLLSIVHKLFKMAK